MSKSDKNNLVLQGSILAIASLLVRLIGMLYRIPLVNILGDDGSGYYAAAYTVYAYMLVISSYGFPAAVSKLVSARLAKNRYKDAHTVFRTTLVLATSIGLLASSILYFGAEWFTAFIEIPGATLALQGLAPALFIFSFMAVFRGYFQGMNTMVPTAISQIVEQIFNAAFSLILASYLLTRGSLIDEATGLQYGAAGSSLGTASGAFASMVFLLFVYFMMRPVIHRKCKDDLNMLDNGSIGYYWKVLMMTALPIIIGTSTFHLANFIDMIMFNKALAFHGVSEESIAMAYGILEGKYKILITLPVSVATAMATASIPSVTRSLVLGDENLIKRKVDLAIRSVLIVAIPAMVGLYVLAEPVLTLLFTNLDRLDLTVQILKLGSLSVPLFAMSTISIGLLQGLDKLKLPVKHSLISVIVKVLFNILLLYVFNLHLYGAVATNIIFAGTSAFLNFRSVRRYIGLKVNVYRTIVAPILASLIMGGVTIGIYSLLLMRLSSDLSTIIVLPVAVVAYFASLLKLKAFDEDEITSLPMGNKLKRFI